MALSASIIINTYNRADSLERTLQSLRYLDYPSFEVIVVNGPSTDGTDAMLSRWANDIKIGSCPERNLSISRNIGIAMAAGDIVAFIDDDAIPEPEWLARLVEGYDSEQVGGVGGMTYGFTGYQFQARYLVRTRFCGERLENEADPTPYYNFPQAREYCGFIGTNASFRRDVLVRIGGFDEEIEYFGDEVDVCARMIDRGFVAKYVDAAFVHHKFLPSHIRNDNRVLTSWYPVIKNQAYFSVKNAARTHSFHETSQAILDFVEEHRQAASKAVDLGLLEPDELQVFESTAVAAMKTGIERGLSQKRKLLRQQTLSEYAGPFKHFPVLLEGSERLTVCFLSQEFPPGFNGGIARFTSDLARGIAGRGHNVHVITRGNDHNTVDFEDGLWVHRIVPQEFETPEIPSDFHVCRKNLNYSRTVHEELKRIDTHHRIDVVEAPIWDSEGMLCVLDDSFKNRTVISLETTLKLVTESNPGWKDNPDIQRAIGMEEQVLRNARAFHAISRGIVDSISQKYDFGFEGADVGLIPLGIKDRAGSFSGGEAGAGLTVLFVGRLEKRKGIDVLLGVIPRILKKHEDVRFVLVGDDSIANDEGVTFKDEFFSRHAGEALLDRVVFAGRVPEDELYRHYAGCSIFVAPSRYESFGLIFLEAMMFRKPVIGCRAGGMSEIIEDGVNGYLAEPGDEKTLGDALERLIVSEADRTRFGQNSRRIFESRFDEKIMVDGVLDFFARVKNGSPVR